MSRSEYCDDLDTWSLVRWRGAVTSALRGKRGQALLRELADAMDAMPEKRLISEELVSGGDYCALGVVGKARGVDLEHVDPDDALRVAQTFDIAEALAREIVYENDEGSLRDETPEQRWSRMRKWVERHLVDEQATTDTQPTQANQ